MRCLKCLTAALLVLSAVAVADAGAPWNAGYKVFHQNQQPTMSRRSYSYAPAAAAPVAAAAPTVAAPAAPAAPAAAAPSAAPSTQVQPRAYRSNSYQPGYRAYSRVNNGHSPFWKEPHN